MAKLSDLKHPHKTFFFIREFLRHTVIHILYSPLNLGLTLNTSGMMGHLGSGVFDR